MKSCEKMPDKPPTIKSARGIKIVMILIKFDVENLQPTSKGFKKDGHLELYRLTLAPQMIIVLLER